MSQLNHQTSDYYWQEVSLWQKERRPQLPQSVFLQYETMLSLTGLVDENYLTVNLDNLYQVYFQPFDQCRY